MLQEASGVKRGFLLSQTNAERDTWRQDLTLTTRGRPLLDVPWSLKMLRMTSTVGSTRGADPKIWLENFGPSRMWQVFLLVIFGTPCGDTRLGGMLGPVGGRLLNVSWARLGCVLAVLRGFWREAWS